MIYFIDGLEDYVRDLRVKELTKGITVETFDCWSEDAEETWQSDSLFGPKCIVVELAKLEADDRLERSLRNAASENTLIITAKKAKENTKVYKLLVKKGRRFACDKLGEQELEKHIIKGLRHLQIKMTGNACSLFVDRSGYYDKEEVTLYTINTYLKQLAYSSSEITEEIVDAIIPRFLDEDVMRLTELLFSRQTQKFFQLISELLAAKQEPVQMLGLLLRHYRIAYKASLYPDKSEKELQELLGLRYRQMKSVEEVRNCTKQQILNGITILQAAAFDIKSGKLPGTVAFILAAGKLVDSISQ